MITSHAQERIELLLPVVGKRAMCHLAHLAVENINAAESVAVALHIAPCEDPTGRNWGNVNTLIAIIRGGCIVTVFLSRKTQVRRDHLCTERIVTCH